MSQLLGVVHQLFVVGAVKPSICLGEAGNFEDCRGHLPDPRRARPFTVQTGVVMQSDSKVAHDRERPARLVDREEAVLNVQCSEFDEDRT